ncbi:MAG: shikimate kinase [Pseudomonadota bacterium]|nr:shikimate kinase [Pseudomonadota bacterium]
MIDTLSHYHPLVIEGMGAYDTRKPASVAAVIVRQLQTRWLENPATKPVLLITQGDPYEPSGISAITRIVADQLDLSRALIFLDPEIADYHAPNADRYKVIFELSYSTMVNTLRTAQPCVVKTIEATVDDHLAAKNARRSMLGKTPLPAYYRTFALLQEVTKISCKQVCSGVTVAHTSRSISDFSVSSFYRVGLELGLIDPSEMVPYAD